MKKFSIYITQPCSLPSLSNHTVVEILLHSLVHFLRQQFKVLNDLNLGYVVLEVVEIAPRWVHLNEKNRLTVSEFSAYFLPSYKSMEKNLVKTDKCPTNITNFQSNANVFFIYFLKCPIVIISPAL